MAFAMKDRHRCPVDGSRLRFADDAYVCSQRGDYEAPGGHEWDIETIDTADPTDGLAAADRVYRWWNAGGVGHELQPLTVIRVNRTTITVANDHGHQFRLPVANVVRFIDEGEDS